MYYSVTKFGWLTLYFVEYHSNSFSNDRFSFYEDTSDFAQKLKTKFGSGNSDNDENLKIVLRILGIYKTNTFYMGIGIKCSR